MLPENAAHAAAEEGSVWLRPWRILLIGLAAVVVGSLLMAYDGPVVTPLRLIFMVAGLIAGGWAVKRRLKTAGEELNERVETAGLVAVYSLAGLVGYSRHGRFVVQRPHLLRLLHRCTIIGSGLVLLPRVLRRLAATLLILLHFGGIVVAANSQPATNGQMSWVVTLLNINFYRPYLSGMYLTNSYHFYAPDPGNSTLVWLRIEYANGEHRWLKLPDRHTTATP